ncbi:MAG: hypothetical protein PHP45_11255 [Elusimicrobiales bacterium]|nr:hypothetical protein [Elusimicrobiales bacterium]
MSGKKSAADCSFSSGQAAEKNLIKNISSALSDSSGSNMSPLRRLHAEEPLPSRAAVLEAVELLRAALYPGYFGGEEFSQDTVSLHVGLGLERARRILEEQVRRAFCFFCADQGDCSQCRGRAAAIVRGLLESLPEMQRLLSSDVQAAYEGDPAAIHPAETVLCYPCVLAVTNQRIAHELYRRQVPLIPRIMTEAAHSATGIDIHPGAAIGPRFFIDHGTGVVIGETCTIGSNVKIYQGVTLGAKSFPLDEHGHPIKGVKRHPDVADDVTIYAGATILGDIAIGKGAVIGGNLWITKSVPPGAKVTQVTPSKTA